MGGQTKDRAKTTPAVMCVKILLHIFNLIYLIIGACVLGLGIWIQVQLKNYIALTELYYANSAWIMVGVGVLIVLVALGGFCCTAKDKVALLYMYGVFITLIAVLQIAAGIAGAVMSKKINTEFENGLTDSIKNHDNNMNAWDDVQKILGCCGVNNPSDWTNSSLGNMAEIPKSCYYESTPRSTSASTNQSSTATQPTAVNTSPTNQPSPTTATTKPTTTGELTTTKTPEATTNTSATNSSEPASHMESSETTAPTPSSASQSRKRRAATTDETGMYTEGCHSKIVEKVSSYLSIIVGVCVGFVLLQIIGAILACCLAKMTKKNNYEQIY